MREHEVPTHVQAEDRVLLWFTFPQIVAITAVSALSYGAYSYVPGPSEMRMALAAVIGLAGIAMVVGKIGGRRLPLVAADLLKYRLGARLYAGSPAQLVRSEPPAPVESGPGPLSLMAKRGRRGARAGCGSWQGAASAGCGETADGETDGRPSVRTAGSASAAKPGREERTATGVGQQAMTGREAPAKVGSEAGS